jgi:hypothetical protein
VVSLVFPGLIFGAAVPEPDTADLTFEENFATAFGIRIIPKKGPFTMLLLVWPLRDSSVGTDRAGHHWHQLLARVKKLGSAAASISVPNFAVSSTNQLAAYLIVGGKPVGGTGNSSVPIAAGSVDILYEVAEYNGSGGGYTIDTFTVPAALFEAPGRRWRTPRRPYSTATSGPSTRRAPPAQPRPSRASFRSSQSNSSTAARSI